MRSRSVLLALILFRLLYHGDVVPNTVRAKVGLSGLTLLVTRDVARLPAKPGRHTAGHEKLVPADYFLEQRPAILEAVLVDARNPGSPSVGIDLTDPIVQQEYEVRVQPLGDTIGFSENDALRTVRRKAR